MLTAKTKELISAHKLKLNPDYGQHFLIDQKILDELVKLGNISDSDIVLEIGAGLGFLTEKLAEKSKKVIAVEIDSQFQPILSKMPTNVEIVLDDALKVLSRNQFHFNKLIASLPYQICEPLLQKMILDERIVKAVLVVPITFAYWIKDHPLFEAFFKVEVIREITKEHFYPVPDVKSAVLVLERKDLAEMTYWNRVVRELYFQREKKLKNGLREALINVHFKDKKEQLNKKQANQMIESYKFSSGFMEKIIGSLKREDYLKIEEKFKIISII